MSGFSGEATCPNCGGSCDEYTDYKPFSYTSIQCYHCGLIISPQIEYLSLEELNDARISNEMEELIKLPRQEKDLW